MSRICAVKNILDFVTELSFREVLWTEANVTDMGNECELEE